MGEEGWGEENMLRILPKILLRGQKWSWPKMAVLYYSGGGDESRKLPKIGRKRKKIPKIGSLPKIGNSNFYLFFFLPKIGKRTKNRQSKIKYLK